MPISPFIFSGQRMLVLVWHGPASSHGPWLTQEMAYQAFQEWMFISGAGAAEADLLERVYFGQIP